MKVYRSWKGIKEKHHNLVLGLGNFDGIHLGHQKLIKELVSTAKDIGGTPAVFTFYPHPLAILKPDNAPPMLLSQEAKQRMMAHLGVEVLLWVPFTLELAALTPEEFIRDVLHNELGVKAVFVGFNYTFGHKGLGTPEVLENYSSLYGYNVHVIPPFTVGGNTVSSTLIRHLLSDGEVTEARKYLGYCPFVEGPVVTGERRGRQLGFPTANLQLERGILVPANGVYAVKVQVDGDTCLGVANIGVKPTFHGQNGMRTIEVHLLDFVSDLYGKNIKVHFSRRLREERRFSSPTELVMQIQKDISAARAEYLE